MPTRTERARRLGVPVDQLPDGRGKHGHNRRGSAHHRWNSGRLMAKDGYVLVRLGRSHPWADPNGYCREHDLVMGSAIGRPLQVGEVVHHRNGDKTDNRLENLQLTTPSEHNELHGRMELTAAQVQAIRCAYVLGTFTQARLADHYGLPHKRISKIIRGETWRAAGGPISHEDHRMKDALTGRFCHAAAGRLLDGVEYSEMPKVVTP